MLSKEQISTSLHKMRQNVKAAGAQSIGITIYPPYPEGSFDNPVMSLNNYQNGADWTWFGARMITGLVENGFVQEAYNEIQPMIDRVIEHDGFYEFYSIDGDPGGSSSFRGSAGELMRAIQALRQWAEQ